MRVFFTALNVWLPFFLEVKLFFCNSLLFQFFGFDIKNIILKKLFEKSTHTKKT